MPRIIGIFGHKRAGKDTFAKALASLLEEHFFEPTVIRSFAAPLYDLVLSAFRFPTRDVEVLKKDQEPFHFTRHALECVDRFLAEAGLDLLTAVEREQILSFSGLPTAQALRRLLQYIATDVVRKRSPSFWIDFCFQTLPEDKTVIISDGRFLSELKAVQQRGFTVGLRRLHFPLQDEHPSEKEALEAAKAADLFFPLPEGLSYLHNAVLQTFEILQRIWR